MKEIKPKIYFVPVYIASMKYYAKLFPYLSNTYDVRFLIVRGRNERREQMEKFCKDNNYKFSLIEDGLNDTRIRVPFFNVLNKRRQYIKAVREFFKKEHPDKVVLTKNFPPFDVLIKEARRLEIDTIMLQWAMTGTANLYADRQQKPINFIQKMYYIALDFLYIVVGILFGGLRYIRTEELPDKIGVIDEHAAEAYPERYGYSTDLIEIVGMADFQIVREIKNKIESDKSFRKNLEGKYNLISNKMNISVLAWNYHKKERANITFEEHIDYFYNVINMIREVYAKEEADILFKLHPSDDPQIYKQYEELGVKIYADDVATEDIVCISDLCVTDPWTSANYIVIASNVPSIFVNFSRMRFLNEGMKYFNIKYVATQKEIFLDMVRQFKEKKLPYQYDNSSFDENSIDKIVKFITD